MKSKELGDYRKTHKQENYQLKITFLERRKFGSRLCGLKTVLMVRRLNLEKSKVKKNNQKEKRTKLLKRI